MKNSKHTFVLQTETSSFKKIFLKTRPADWIDSEQPFIFPLSVHSVFHRGVTGEMKIAALLHLVSNNAKQMKTVLICQYAHLHTLNMHFDNMDHIKNTVDIAAHQLVECFKKYLASFEVAFWDKFVSNHANYGEIKREIEVFYKQNSVFQDLLRKEAEEKYCGNQQLLYPDKTLYLKNACLDMLEQCIYLIIALMRGYRFEFYPGRRPTSVEFFHQEMLKNGMLSEPLTRVNVTVSSPVDLKNVQVDSSRNKFVQIHK